MKILSQVLADGQEVGAYMFRRTLADVHLTPDDVRWMVSYVELCLISSVAISSPFNSSHHFYPPS